jgi:hypothetical protein
MPALTDKQKADLKKHVDKVGGTPAEKKSHRMKMISRMSRGMSLAKAHKDIQEGQKKLVKDAKKFVKKNEGKRYGAIKNPTPARFLKEAAKEIFPKIKDSTTTKPTETTIRSSDGEIINFKLGGKEISGAERNKIMDLALLKNTALVQSENFIKSKREDNEDYKLPVSPKGFDEDYFKARLPEAWESYTGGDPRRGPASVKLTRGEPKAGGKITFFLTPEEGGFFKVESAGAAPKMRTAKGRAGFTALEVGDRPATAEDAGTYTRGLVYRGAEGFPVPEKEVQQFIKHLAKFGSGDFGLSHHAKEASK